MATLMVNEDVSRFASYFIDIKADGYGTQCRLPRRFAEGLYRSTEKGKTPICVPIIWTVNGSKPALDSDNNLILGKYAFKLIKMGSEYAEFDIGWNG